MHEYIDKDDLLACLSFKMKMRRPQSAVVTPVVEGLLEYIDEITERKVYFDAPFGDLNLVELVPDPDVDQVGYYEGVWDALYAMRVILIDIKETVETPIK